MRNFYLSSTYIRKKIHSLCDGGHLPLPFGPLSGFLEEKTYKRSLQRSDCSCTVKTCKIARKIICKTARPRKDEMDRNNSTFLCLCLDLFGQNMKMSMTRFGICRLLLWNTLSLIGLYWIVSSGLSCLWLDLKKLHIILLTENNWPTSHAGLRTLSLSDNR